MPTIHDLSTPCLLLDLDSFETNLERMSRCMSSRGVALRPHAKTHKCPEIAKLQIERGAIGICAATIAEAEMLCAAGIPGILITAELVGEPKLSRFVRLLRQAPDTMLVVDDPANLRELDDALRPAGLRADVLLDLDVGQNRTGVPPGDPAVALARATAGCAQLRLAGICAYAGHLAHVQGFDERRRRSREALAQAIETRDQLIREGHDIRIISGGSTGTYNIDSEIPGITEIQAGSYVFMDAEYRSIGGPGAPLYTDFSNALHVWTTVIHRSGNKAIVDAGLKAFSTDSSFKPLAVADGITYEFAGDEHGRLRIAADGPMIRLGDRLRLVVPHCDPNVNLYDRIHCARGESVVDTWSIMNRSGGYF